MSSDEAVDTSMLLFEEKEVLNTDIKIEETKMEETKMEDNKKVEENLNTMVDLLIVILKNNELLKKLNIILNEKEINLLIKLLKSNPNFFNETKSSLINIISDNQVNFKDIPYILDLIKKFYEVLHNIKDNKISVQDTADACSNILKFIIHFIVLDGKVNIENSDDFLTNIDNLIDSSVELLKLTKTLKLNKSMFSWLC
jgi:hypothetical protein